MSEMTPDGQPFDAVMKEKAQLVLKNLEDGDVGTAVRELIHINDARNDSIYQQIGKITRGLHDAISNLELQNGESGPDEGRDVHARVGYVIKLTQEAANKTMDLAELATPIAAELGSESTKLRQEWKKLGARQLSAEEFRSLYRRTDDFLGYAEGKSSQLHSYLTDIVVAQGYQDLSGQVLYKIMNMLEATEHDLVTLVAMAGRMQDVSGIDPEMETKSSTEKDIVAEGPIPDAASTLNSQDEVDDLLSSLGF